MPFLLLLVLSLACMPIRWPRPFLGLNEWQCALLTWTAVGAVVSVAAVIARWTRARLANDPLRLETIQHWYSILRLYHLFGLFGTFAVILSALGWGWTVRQLCTPAGAEEMFAAAELLLLAPFFAALVGSWICFYDAERALHAAATSLGINRPFWSRGAYVVFHVRHNLALVLAPLSLLILEQGLLRQFPELAGDWRFRTIEIILALAVFAGLPWLLRLVWGLTPLPPGPLRDRLGEAAGRLRFRCSNILLWNTRGGVGNAMVVGVLPWPRYVLLTDRLLSELTPDEVEAVFGHEAGHVKHHHMLCYFGFFIISVTVLFGTWMAIEGALGQAARTYLPQHVAFLLDPNEDWSAVPLAGFLIAYIFVVFGFLSRRCERQADIYGCRAVSCARSDCLDHEPGLIPSPGGKSLCPTGIRIFIHALEKVARINGISRSRPGWLQSWQHSTIASRVQFLQAMLADPELEPRFQRTVVRVKWGLFLGLGAALAVLAATQDWKTLLPF